MLLHPQAWDLLTDEDKKEVLALFPDERHIMDLGTPDARPNVISLQNDDNFRHDTEEYVSNLSRDMHDPSWLQDAWAAHGSRAAGNFDQYYVRRLEADWKTAIPDDLKPGHLHPVPKSEASVVVDQLVEGDGAVDNAEVGNITAAIETNGSAGTDDSAQGNGNVEAENISVDVSKGDAEDGFSKDVVNGIEQVSGVKVNETGDIDPDKMQTGPE